MVLDDGDLGSKEDIANNHGDAFINHGDAFNNHGDAFNNHGDAFNKHGILANKLCECFHGSTNDLSVTHGSLRNAEGELNSGEGIIKGDLNSGEQVCASSNSEEGNAALARVKRTQP